jgi:hypothetical protein
MNAGMVHGLFGGELLGLPNLKGIVFDPTRLGIVLL